MEDVVVVVVVVEVEPFVVVVVVTVAEGDDELAIPGPWVCMPGGGIPIFIMGGGGTPMPPTTLGLCGGTPIMGGGGCCGCCGCCKCCPIMFGAGGTPIIIV